MKTIVYVAASISICFVVEVRLEATPLTIWFCSQGRIAVSRVYVNAKSQSTFLNTADGRSE